MFQINRPDLPRIKLVIMIGAVSVFLIPVLIISLAVFSKTWNRTRLNDICPDYHSELYAWIVDKSGNGIDSVSVTLKDNANYNLIYRTFTDSTGKFILFNDFGSFALYNMPFSYELQVFYNGYTDTVLYKFQRYRFCHFRKTDGPDTIVLDPSNDNQKQIITEYRKKIAVEEAFEYAPFQKIALYASVPAGLQKSLQQWKTVKYGSLDIGKQRVLFAVTDRIPVQKADTAYQKGKVWLVIDRNQNNNLEDDLYKPWDLLYSSNKEEDAECDIRQCFMKDTLIVCKEKMVIDLQLEGFHHKNTLLHYRRGDALKTMVEIQGQRLRLVLWDRLLSRYSDLQNVQFGIDRNSDNRFSSKAGDKEIVETAASGIGFGSIHYQIDSIAPDGSVLFYSKTTMDSIVKYGASIGDWANDFKGIYAQPLSLYNEISGHSLVVLCFFEGNSQQCMETSELGTFIRILKERISSIRIIGINRKTFGPYYTAFPVIEENMGWKGSLVRQFHNHLSTEVICIDSTATIVSRGAPDRVLLESLWTRLGRKDLAAVFYELDRAEEEGSVIGSVNW